MELSETSRWLIQLALAVLAFGTAAWFYLDFAPRLQPTIEVVATDPQRRVAVLRLRIENVSRVLVHTVSGGCTFQAVPRPIREVSTRSGLVPLTRAYWDAEAEKYPGSLLGSWKEPIRNAASRMP